VALFDWCAQSEKGPSAEHNEDTVFAEPGYGIFIVADGMGGRPGGGQASHVAVRTFRDYLRRVNPIMLADPAVLRKAVLAANTAVLAIGRSEPNMGGMGTTLSAAILTEKGSRIVHVGDSRIYRFGGGRLEQITEDHTLVSEIMAQNVVPDAVARQLPIQNVLSQAVGSRPTVEPDIEELVLRPGEWLLLATDGLTKTLPDERLRTIFAANEKAGAQAVCRAMVQAALAAVPKDNVTLAVVRAIGKS
jgi:protein phosphatase